MISFQNALDRVLEQQVDYGAEEIPLENANWRILAEDIRADRDFPPFNRATKDGIAIAYEAVENGRLAFEVKGVLAAGQPTIAFVDTEACIEIMTGAVVPFETDTVVMYEDLVIQDDIASLKKIPERGQNIHPKASDRKKGEVILTKGQRITPAEMGVLATVGKSRVRVLRMPKTAVISTGNELVEIDQIPLPYQLRRSNTVSLHAALVETGIKPMRLHITDDIDLLRQKLAYLLDEMDVLILSGGVSKGKFDYLPQVFEELGVEKIFHRVAQRPGKPFLFGRFRHGSKLVFSFPGNPVSTFLNFHLYFMPWLRKISGQDGELILVKTEKALENHTDLTIFKGATLMLRDACLRASVVESSGSGDLAHLSDIAGFIQLEPGRGLFEAGTEVPFIPTKQNWGL
jgi:molybdopterin molybdotransferase